MEDRPEEVKAICEGIPTHPSVLAVRSYFESLESRLAVKDHEIKKLMENLCNEAREKERFMVRAEKAEADYKTAQDALETQRRNHETQIAWWQARVRDLEVKVGQLSRRNDELTGQVDDLKESLEHERAAGEGKNP